MQLVTANGTVYELRKAETRIGRSESNDIAIDDPGMSRHHAVVRLAAGQVMIQDLSSTNGTFVNGRRVHAAVVLQHADRIEIAKTILWVRQPDLPNPDHMPTELMPPHEADPKATMASGDDSSGAEEGQLERSRAKTARLEFPDRDVDEDGIPLPAPGQASAAPAPSKGGRRVLGILSIGLGLLGTTAAVTGAAIPSVGFYCISGAVVLAVAALITGVLAVMRRASRVLGVVGLAISVISLIAIFTVVMLAISAYSSGVSPLPLPLP